MVTDIDAKSIEVKVNDATLRFDIQDAEFNGDRTAPAGSMYISYLVCDFRNLDRYSFGVLRPPRSAQT